MIGFILKKIIGSKNDREVKRLRSRVDEINRFEAELQNQPADVLRQKTAAWKEELSKITDNEELARRLDEILPEAFAVVKNAARRMCGSEIIVREHPLKWEMVHFDVQLIGGMGLHGGKIAEMATGEGKTLVATLPVYLNALTGRGVHVVTVNDYLAARDSEWMGAVYKYIGLTVGCILHDQSPAVRREQYSCDITYGTNAEFGFDYLRDNGMASRAEEQVQRGHYFAIVDEVDSILIDEARTPLIISGPAVVGIENDQYAKFKPTIENLVRNQERLCNRFLSEAEELIKKLRPADGSQPEHPAEIERELGLLLYRVKIGQPRSEGLARLLEDPENLKLMNKAELQLHADQTKKDLYAQKEELFFAIEEKGHEADLTEKGRSFLSPKDPDAFMMPDVATAYTEIDINPDLNPQQRLEQKQKIQAEFETKAQSIHTIGQLLKAFGLYQKDVQYVVQENKVIIVDENTGRLMTGRRWSDGLHQAVEAKEGVEIERETQTYATITIQNYFRLYTKLAGMTGTAETEAGEFHDIYKLGVLVIPTNRPIARKDKHDTVYKTRREKFNAVLKEIQEIHALGRPILVGTISVDVSEQLSRMLKKAGLIHSVLNAKFHQQEAEIVSRAGQRGSITIATNMAGRGTDIKLGPGVAEAGGLHVLATERHEARRIDRQLRGRCARQGDPGSSHFFIALEDDLMRLFGSDRIVKVMERVGLEEGQELEHPLLNRSIETAQKRVEQHNFQIRKRTLEYDDVMNKQREVLYGFRNEIIHAGIDQSDEKHWGEAIDAANTGKLTEATTLFAKAIRRNPKKYCGVGFGAWKPAQPHQQLLWIAGMREAGFERLADEFVRRAAKATEETLTQMVSSEHELEECLSETCEQLGISEETSVRDRLMDIMEEVVISKVDEFTSKEEMEEWNIRGLSDWVNLNFPLGFNEQQIRDLADSGKEAPVAGSAFDGLTPQQFAVCTKIADEVRKAYELKISFEQPDALKSIERYTILSAIDKLWQEHLYNMDSLRNSIGLRAYGQRDPLIEYKTEAFTLFDDLMVNIKTEVCHNIFRSASSMMAFENFLRSMPKQTQHGSVGPMGGGTEAAGNPSDVVSEASEAVSKAQPIRTGPKVGRNDPCPCGSGKKFKQCCGK